MAYYNESVRPLTFDDLARAVDASQGLGGLGQTDLSNLPPIGSTIPLVQTVEADWGALPPSVPWWLLGVVAAGIVLYGASSK